MWLLGCGQPRVEKACRLDHIFFMGRVLKFGPHSRWRWLVITLKRNCGQVVVVFHFIPSTWEAEARKTMFWKTKKKQTTKTNNKKLWLLGAALLYCVCMCAALYVLPLHSLVEARGWPQVLYSFTSFQGLPVSALQGWNYTDALLCLFEVWSSC